MLAYVELQGDGHVAIAQVFPYVTLIPGTMAHDRLNFAFSTSTVAMGRSNFPTTLAGRRQIPALHDVADRCALFHPRQPMVDVPSRFQYVPSLLRAYPLYPSTLPRTTRPFGVVGNAGTPDCLIVPVHSVLGVEDNQ